MERISEELKKQLIELAAKNPDSETLDAEALQRELSQVGTFDENFATEFDVEDKPAMISVGGGNVRVHRTNNFTMIFSILAELKAGRPPQDMFEQAYAAASDRHYGEILDVMEQMYPNLYAKMTQIAKRQRQLVDLAKNHPESKEAERAATVHETDDEKAERRLYASAAYVACAKIAREQIDPHYNLAYLYK